MRKKAFTLVELLAIIVILAIIAVITVPIILNIIDNAKIGTIKDSALAYKEAINKYYMTKLSENENIKLNGTYEIKDGKMHGTGIDNVEIPVTGNIPTNGSLVYENNILKSGYLIFDKYRVEFNEGNIKSSSKGYIGTSGEKCGYTYSEYEKTSETGLNECIGVEATETGTTYTTCTLDDDWTQLSSTSVNASSCSESETATNKVTCGSITYACGTSWKESTTSGLNNCSKGSKPTSCQASTQSYVSNCSPNVTVTGYTCASRNDTCKVVKKNQSSCSCSSCSYGYSCSTTYTKTTQTRTNTAKKTKTTYVKYYTKEVYTRTKTENTCWIET